jgi:hypothetical protein
MYYVTKTVIFNCFCTSIPAIRESKQIIVIVRREKTISNKAEKTNKKWALFAEKFIVKHAVKS